MSIHRFRLERWLYPFACLLLQWIMPNYKLVHWSNTVARQSPQELLKGVQNGHEHVCPSCAED